MLIITSIAFLLIVNSFYLPQDAFSCPETAQLSTTGSDISSTPIEFNKKVFSWTDRVYIKIVAPDFNSDPNVVDVIGLTSDDKVTVSTTGHSIPYKLAETGVNTGIFKIGRASCRERV